MPIRLAAVSFLNTLPLIADLEALAGGRISLTRAIPSALAGLMDSGQADVALLPVVEVFRGRSGGIIGRSGIACRGAVDSVKLFSRRELKDIATVHVDRGSRTSVALLRVLLAETQGIRPAFTTCTPRVEEFASLSPAVLVIGDRCFEFERELRRAGEADWQEYDLGEMWFAVTGLPFVFAVWAVAPGLEGRLSAADLDWLGGILARARDSGLARIDELAAAAVAEGRLGRDGEATAEAIAYYFHTSLRYRLDDDEIAGLRLFHRKCIEHDLVPDGPLPPVF